MLAAPYNDLSNTNMNLQQMKLQKQKTNHFVSVPLNMNN